VYRKYTPVTPSISIVQPLVNSLETSSKDTLDKSDASQKLHFIIKIYPDGDLTKELGLLRVNEDSVEIGCCGGSFNQKEFLEGVSTLVLLAAGSGITPFVRIIRDSLANGQNSSSTVSRILLLFFNETEEDIIWRDQWEQLAKQEPTSFYFCPVISKVKEGNNSWMGLSGRVSSKLLEKCFEDAKLPEHTSSKALICGSYGFNDACKQ
jgi:cytochrome-b5 reductase